MSLDNTFGGARLGGGQYTKKKYFKLKDGESIFRILPSVGEGRKDLTWSAYYQVHYGYKNSAGKGRYFLSPLVVNRTNKMVECPDAALEFIDKVKAQIEIAKKSGDKATVDKLTEFAGGQKSRFNLDKKHYMNAMDLQGNIGILKLSHRAKLALEATIAELRAKGVDPLSATDGRYLAFRRTGTAFDTAVKVTVHTESVETKEFGIVERQVVSTLTPDIAERVKTEAELNLKGMFKVLTSEQVQKIVSTVDLKTGISPAIDEFFGNSDNADNGPPADYEEESNHNSAPPAATAPQPAATAPPPASAVAAAVTPDVAALIAPAATQAAAPAAVYTPPPAATYAPPPAAAQAQAAPKTTAQAVAETSNLDFLAGLGVKIG